MRRARQYSVQPTQMINSQPWGSSVVEPDKKLVETLHKLLDLIPNDDHALAIDHVVADLLRVNRRPDGMFEPELLPKHPTPE